MKINVNNTAKIQNLLEEVNGSRNARISVYHDVKEMVEYAERQFKEQGLPKRLQVGATIQNYFIVSPAYKWQAECTVIKLQKSATSWFVVEIKRTNALKHKDCEPSERYELEPVREAKEYLKEKYYTNLKWGRI